MEKIIRNKTTQPSREVISQQEPDAWSRVGKVVGISGIKGLIKIKSFCEKPEDIEKYTPLIIEGLSNEFDIRVVNNKNGILKVAVLDIDNVEKAKDLVGSFLLAHKKTFPKTEPDEYYYSELIGLKVFGKSGEPFGAVIDVSDFGAGAFLEVKCNTGRKTQLVPFNANFVLSVNIEEQQITVDLFAL